MKHKITSKAFDSLKETVNAKSYYELANLLNTQGSALQRYKNGDVSISVDKLNDIANKLDCELEIKFKKNS